MATTLIYNPLLKKGLQYVTVEANYTQVATYADLPVASTVTGQIYFVQTTTGSIWTFNKKDAGLYRSNGSTWIGANVPSYFSSSEFRVQDNLDASKQFALDISGVTTVTTRTWIVPNFSDTLVGLTGSQAITGKTYNGLTITTTTATLNLAGNLITTGAFNTTFTVSGSNTITFPNASITVARIDAGQTFTGTQAFAGITATSITNSGLTATRVPFSGTGGLMTDSANLTWDNSNGTLNIGGSSTAAAFPLDILGSVASNPLWFRIKNSSASGTINIIAQNSAGGFTALQKYGGSASAYRFIGSSDGVLYNSGSAGNLCIYNDISGANIYMSTSASSTVQFLLNSTGYVGIGNLVGTIGTGIATMLRILAAAGIPGIRIDYTSGTADTFAYFNGATKLTSIDSAGRLTIVDTTQATSSAGAIITSGGISMLNSYLGGNISVAAWTTSGIGFKIGASTYTDSSSSGTVALQYAHAIAAPTFAASSATTYTSAITLFIDRPAAGTNVTNTTTGALMLGGSLLFTSLAPNIGTIDNFGITFKTNNSTRYSISAGGSHTWSNSIVSTGIASPIATYTTAAHTNQTLNSEVTDVLFNLSAVLKMADGTVPLQRTVRYQARTYTPQTSTLTLTQVATLDVEAPIAGSGTTITNGFGIRTTGNLSLATVGNKIFIKTGSGGSAGQVALVAGTKAITIAGVTTSTLAYATIASQAGTVSTTVGYECACTANTLTINAVTNAGTNTVNILDTSTLNYFIIEPAP